jgi:O-acetyl-ADP-ribose deacetylase (regulator of RNase III)
MSVAIITGDLFEVKAQTIVNPVNCVGVMGGGLAKEFASRYPDMLPKYKELCRDRRLRIGTLWMYEAADKWILNFPTKDHWRNPSELDYIRQGLTRFVEGYAIRGVESIAFPMLGCGLGGLDWESQVKPLMLTYLSIVSIPVTIVLPEVTSK